MHREEVNKRCAGSRRRGRHVAIRLHERSPVPLQLGESDVAVESEGSAVICEDEWRAWG